MWPSDDQTCTSSIDDPPSPPPPLRHHCVATLKGHTSYTSALALAGEHLFTGSSSGQIHRAGLTSLPHHQTLPDDAMIAAGEGAVKALVASSVKLITAHQDHKIRVWRVDHAAGNQHQRITQLATLPTLSDRAVKLLLPGNHVRVRRHKTSTWVHHVDAVSALALSGDESLLYSVSWDRTLKIWRTADFKCLESVADAHDDAINAVALSGNGAVYTGSSDGKIKVWTRRQGEKAYSLAATLTKHKATTFRPATRPEVRLQQITADRSKEGGGKNPGVSVVAAAQSSLPPPNHYYGVANCQKPTGAAAMAAGAAEAATNRTSPVGQKRVETQLMADAALERLLEKLQQLLLYEAQLVKNVKTQLEKLEMNLRVFRAFLADFAQSVKDDDDAVFEELVRQASDVIYEVEDVVDQCRRRSRNSAAVCEAKTSVNTDSGLTYNFSTGVGRDLLIASAGPGGFSTVDAIQNTKTHQNPHQNPKCLRIFKNPPSYFNDSPKHQPPPPPINSLTATRRPLIKSPTTWPATTPTPWAPTRPARPRRSSSQPPSPPCGPWAGARVVLLTAQPSSVKCGSVSVVEKGGGWRR